VEFPIKFSMPFAAPAKQYQQLAGSSGTDKEKPNRWYKTKTFKY
jgi:hypothetical protein